MLLENYSKDYRILNKLKKLLWAEPSKLWIFFFFFSFVLFFVLFILLILFVCLFSVWNSLIYSTFSVSVQDTIVSLIALDFKQ
jgi:hypothetical protein